MVGDGWDCSTRSKMVTTTCFSVMGGVKDGLALSHFSHQDWVSLNWFGQFTASQPFQCLIVSIMNGFARLRFEFIIHNHHCTPAFELWVATRSAPEYPTFHTKMVYVWLVQEYHSISTLPTSNYKYNKWLKMVEIAVWGPKWSPQCVFQSWVGSKLSKPLSNFHTKVGWVWTDLGNSQYLPPFHVSL